MFIGAVNLYLLKCYLFIVSRVAQIELFSNFLGKIQMIFPLFYVHRYFLCYENVLNIFSALFFVHSLICDLF